MAGATAATAAGVSASHASLVTIDLNNNYISGFGGNHLNADLTGDGHPDLTITNAGYFRNFVRTIGTSTRLYTSGADVRLNGILAHAFWSEDYAMGRAAIGSKSAYINLSHGSFTGTIPIFFKDLHINGGAPTEGLLEITVFSSATIQLDSFTYNTPNQGLSPKVADQGSTLALLAMGAEGVLALRRQRVTKGRS